MMKIVIAGGSGYLGKQLCDFYQSEADEIIVLSRSSAPTHGKVKTVLWDAKTIGTWMHELEGADMLINLVGKNVNCRYTERNKNEILSSRLDSTRVLGEAVKKLKTPPVVWIQSSSVTIYRDSRDMVMTEANGIRGFNFSELVCIRWEKLFDSLELPGTRKIILRTGIVLGTSDSALPRLMNLVKFGLGGQQGDGQQFVSWIHEKDVLNTIEWLRTHGDESGIYNCTAPHSVTNRNFMATLRSIMRMPFGLPTPAFLLVVGSFIIRTEPELVLKSRKVYPQRLLDNGFVFEFPDLTSALVDLCQHEKRS
jgi:uncharacterized protein